MTTLCFVDTETTGLDPIRHEMWEIAVIRRETDGTETEHLWQLRPSAFHLRHIADPESLRINRFHERAAVPAPAIAADMLAGPVPVPLAFIDFARQLAWVLKGAVLIGSNPGFDAAFLHRFLQTDPPPWHYRPIDVATLAAGYVRGLAASTQYPGTGEDIAPLPFSSHALSRAVGVEPPGDDAHQALVDARWVRDVYDAVVGKPEVR